MPLWVACRVRAWKARSVPEEPVTFDELERLLLQLMGSSPEALEQQILSHMNRETFVGGKRVTRQELPELPQDAVATVYRVKVSLYGAKPPVWRRLEIPGAMPLNLVHAVLQIAGVRSCLAPARRGRPAGAAAAFGSAAAPAR